MHIPKATCIYKCRVDLKMTGMDNLTYMDSNVEIPKNVQNAGIKYKHEQDELN